MYPFENLDHLQARQGQSVEPIQLLTSSRRQDKWPRDQKQIFSLVSGSKKIALPGNPAHVPAHDESARTSVRFSNGAYCCTLLLYWRFEHSNFASDLWS